MLMDFFKFSIGVGIGDRGSFLPVDHKVGPIVFKLGKNIAKCKDMPHGRRSAEIGNGCQVLFSAHF